MPLPDFAQNGTFYAFYAFYAPRVQRQTHVRVHTSRVTNFAFDTYPRKTHFERRTAQKLARTTFRVVPNCARGGGGWIKSSSRFTSEASALAFGQPARFACGLDNSMVHTECVYAVLTVCLEHTQYGANTQAHVHWAHKYTSMDHICIENWLQIQI